MIKVKRWWLARRLIGKEVFLDEADTIMDNSIPHKLIMAGKLRQVDWWGMDAYAGEWIGGPFFITIDIFIKALFSKPTGEQKPWKKLNKKSG